MIPEKKAYQTGGKVCVTHVGPNQPFGVYIFADILEELYFHAEQRNARGMITGQPFRFPVDKALADLKDVDKASPEMGDKMSEVDKPSTDLSNTPRISPDMPDYIEINAFRDMFQCSDALGFAANLRKMRDFRSNGDQTTLGVVALTKEPFELMLEDLLVQRTYFSNPSQILMAVSADRRRPRAWSLTPDAECFIELGVNVVGLAGAKLPFNMDE